MTINNSGIVAGWYADPASTDKMRYWDGSAWTEQTAPLAAAQAAAQAVQQVAPVIPPVAQAVAPEAQFAQTTVVEAAAAYVEPTPVASAPVAGSPAAAAAAAPFMGSTQELNAFAAQQTTVTEAPALVPAAVPAAVPAVVGAPPVVNINGDPRVSDPALAKTARSVATILRIVGWVALILGVLGAAGVLFAGSQVENGFVPAIPAAVGVLIGGVLAWTLWNLGSVVAHYIANRSA